MIIDSTKYSGSCSCGRKHALVTRGAIIESGCLLDFEKYMAQYDIQGKRCALYGENSYKATQGRHPRAEQAIIMDPVGLHANEISTAEVLSKLEPDVDIIIAVGSGTIHDIARFCAHERGIRFVSCPTGASVDGFCSTVAAMTWYGFKKTLPAVAPEIVIADVEVIKNAPIELVKSGIGDIMAKYTALADWRIAHLVTGEYLCERIYSIMKDAADTVMRSVSGIIAGDNDAYANVTYALIMSGIAMQMMGNSRPASGCEHHISHLIEMKPEKLNVKFPAMHGEKTGVGTILATKEYERLAQIEDISAHISPYCTLSDEELNDFCGNILGEALIRENSDDCALKVTEQGLSECWPEIRKSINDIPKSDYLLALLTQLDAKRCLADIGVDEKELNKIFWYSPMVRNRLTLMRLRHMID